MANHDGHRSGGGEANADLEASDPCHRHAGVARRGLGGRKDGNGSLFLLLPAVLLVILSGPR